jgi:hypothetical protein
MYLGGGWPGRARGIAVAGVVAVLAVALMKSLPLAPHQIAGWVVVASGLVVWTLGIRLNTDERPDEVEWIAALAPGALLVLVGGLYAVTEVW